MPRRADPDLGEAICAALRERVEKIGLSIGDEPTWKNATFVEQTDPLSHEISLIGTWRGGPRYGTVMLFVDGRIFAEYQVLLPHPQDAGRYVESMQVWGRAGALPGDAVVVSSIE